MCTVLCCVALRCACQVVKKLQDLHSVAFRDFLSARKYSLMRSKNIIPHSSRALLYVNAVNMPALNDTSFRQALRRLHVLLTCKSSLAYVPTNQEARRRITFFCNSMFMNMPAAPPVSVL